MENARDGRSDPLGPREARRTTRLDALLCQPEPRFGIEEDQRERLHESCDADLAPATDLRGNSMGLGALVERLLVLAEHPRRESRGDQCARPARCRGAAGVRVEERRRVLPRRDVLAADVPVHPQVAAHLHAQLGRAFVAAPGGLEERVHRRLEVPLLRDATFDRADLFSAFDPVADLTGALRRTGERA